MTRGRHHHHEGLIGQGLEAVSRLPWWLNLLLALGAFVALRRVDAPPVLRTAARFGAIIVPLVFIAGAALRLVRARRRKEPWEEG